MRKLKKFAALSLVGMLAASAFVGCGKKTTNNSGSGEGSGEVAGLTDGGKVLNIYVWNDEFINRMVDHYPGYVKVDDLHGKIGDVDVVFTQVANQDNAYQDNLDNTFNANGENQKNAKSPDEKVDIFLAEIDYITKYVNSPWSAPISEYGVTDADLAKQYEYTKQAATDSKGVLKGVSWQACSAAMIYRSDIAEKVFGSSEPDKVQEQVKDWDTFAKAADTLKAAGYQAMASANDSFRVFSNNVTTKWVDDEGVLNIDANIEKWAKLSKEMVDKGQCKTFDLWSNEWNDGMKTSSNVFAYFGPAWLINFCMHASEDGYAAKDGLWKITEGPQSFFWGGTWILGAAGGDNKTLVKDIILKMTTDDAVMEGITRKDSDFVNNTAVNDKLAADANYKNAILGGQNPTQLFVNGLTKIDLSNITAYDQGCNEKFQAAMKDWFDGNYKSYEEALADFHKKIGDKYSDITIK